MKISRTLQEHIGKKYSYLEILSLKYQKHGNSYFTCKCKCGNTTVVRIDNLKNELIRSCGCLIAKKGGYKATDKQMLRAIKKHKTIKAALQKLNLTLGWINYQRANKLIKENNA